MSTLWGTFHTPFARYFNPKKTFNFTNQLLRSEIKFKTANEGTIYETSDGTIHCSAYNTWIQGSTRQDMEDIDPVVQVILYKVLSILKSIPENFKIFIEQKISRMSTELWDSKYYHSKLYVLSELSSLPFDELVANTPHIKVQEVLIESYIKYVTENQNKDNTSNIYNQLLAMQTEIQLGIFNLLNTINFGNVFRILKAICIPLNKITNEPIFIERVRHGKITYRYSRDVVCATYIRLLCLLLKQISNKSLQKKMMEKKEHFEKIMQSLRESTYANKASLKFDRLIAITFKESRTLEAIHYELYTFAHGLKNYRTYFDASIHPVYTLTLYGWISYTIYDNILDGESDLSFLSYANQYNQEMLRLISSQIQNINNPEHISGIIEDILAELNSSQESSVARIQSSKSIGHCIGPILIFSTIAHKCTKTNITPLIQHYRYFLSLKQISDDVHDWEEDLNSKRQTYITEKMWRTSKPNTPNMSDTDWYLQIFSSTIIYSVYDEMKIQTEKSIEALREIEDFFDPVYVQNRIKETKKYISGIEQVIHEIELYSLFKTPNL